MKKLKQIYNTEFYDEQTLGSHLVAKEILKILFKYYKPLSVIDIGCGRGSWLAVAETLGSKYLKGFDGAWIHESDLLTNNIDFTPFDLEKPLNINESLICVFL